MGSKCTPVPDRETREATAAKPLRTDSSSSACYLDMALSSRQIHIYFVCLQKKKHKCVSYFKGYMFMVDEREDLSV